MARHVMSEVGVNGWIMLRLVFKEVVLKNWYIHLAHDRDYRCDPPEVVNDLGVSENEVGFLTG